MKVVNLFWFWFGDGKIDGLALITPVSLAPLLEFRVSIN
jgi:hypothetical protein